MAEAPDLNRRRFLGAGAAAGASALVAACGSSGSTSSTETTATGAPSPHPKTTAEALAILKAGNERYMQGKLQLRDYSPVGDRIYESQKPFAAIITCADSRLSPPLVFDVAHGNLFVSRIAGNTVDQGTLGSTEYAVKVLGAKLILVLGHTDCGAVKTAIKAVQGKGEFPPSKYGTIPAVLEPVIATVKKLPKSRQTLSEATKASALDQAKLIAAKGPIIAPAVQSGKVKVVAGVYDIPTGRVHYLS